MSDSPYYKILSKRSIALQKRFVNFRVRNNPTSSYSQDMIRTYRILLHAEIEHYFEQLVIYKINQAKIKWHTKNHVSPILLSIISFTECSFPSVPDSLAEVSSKNDLSFRINKAVNAFINSIENRNNGIKEKDIVPIIIPLGLDYGRINQTLLNNLSSYGQLRGEVAHKSYKVTKLINPSDEINTSNLLVTDLKDLDNLIWSLA